MDRFTGIARTSLPYAIALSLSAAAFFPDPVSPGITMALGLVLGGVLALIAGVVSRRAVDAQVAMLALAGLACTAWFSATSLMAVNPSVSLMGIIAQHNGAATWIMGFAWLLAASLLAEKKTLRAVLLAAGAVGLGFAVTGGLEVITGGLAQTQDHARAFFENSVSFGQFLAITTVCAAAWVLSSRTKGALLWLMWAGVAFMAYMIDVSDSRTGFVALAAAAALAFVSWRFPAASDTADRWRAGALTALPVALNAGVLAAAMGVLGAGAQSIVARLGTGRDIIWRTGMERLADSPIAGHGLEQFSAWTSWTMTADFLDSKATTDPHNLALTLGLGGGAVGLLLATAVLALLFVVTLRASRSARSLALATAASLPLAVVAAGSVGWVAPATMLAAGAAIGAVIAAASPQGKGAGPEWAARTVRGVTVAIGALTLVMGIVGLQNVGYEVRHDKQSDPIVLAGLHDSWPDPAYATNAVRALTPRILTGDTAAIALAEKTMDASFPDTAWRVELAGAQLIAAQALEASDASRFERFERIVANGMKADPTSGFWYTFAANEASRLDLTEKAADYAAKALGFDLPAQSRTEMEALAR